MSDVARLRRYALLALGTIAATLGACCAVAAFAGARTHPAVVPGRGTWIAGHTDFVGFYRAYTGGRWVKVYCVDPQKRAPTTIGLHTVGRVAGTTRAVTRRLAETLAAHGNAQTVTQAEAVSQALNAEVGNHAAVLRRARYLPHRVGTLAARYVAEASALHGPYRLGIRLPRSPLPGQQATGTVTLRSAAGQPVVHPIALRHTRNVKAPATIHTDRSGRARFRYATISGGAVHLAASARLLPTTVRASRPGSTTQLVLTWSPRTQTRATASYQGTGPGISHRYGCTSDCDGRPEVTLTACAPADRYRSRITFWLGERTHRLWFAAARRRVCQSWQTALADGISVSATWQYRTPSGWTRPLPAQGWFTVDCPAAPPIATLLSFDCTRATLSVALGTEQAGALQPLRNTTRHRMLLLVGGALSARYPLAPGGIARVHTLAMQCGVHQTVTVRSAVQRGSGGYNYGQAVTVRGP